MLEGNMDAMLLHEAAIGVIGFGNLGRALLPLLEPFRATVRFFDSWLPDSALQMRVFPCTLWDLLARSRFVFVLALSPSRPDIFSAASSSICSRWVAGWYWSAALVSSTTRQCSTGSRQADCSPVLMFGLMNQSRPLTWHGNSTVLYSRPAAPVGSQRRSRRLARWSSTT